MTADEFARLALSLSGAHESAHFGTRDFRVGGKIFATLPSDRIANLKLTPDQQAMMLEVDGALFSAVPNAWGLRGWTSLSLPEADIAVALHALEIAWKNVTSKRSGKT